MEHCVGLFLSLVTGQLLVNRSEVPGCDDKGAGYRQGSSVSLSSCTGDMAEQGCAGPCTLPVGIERDSLSPAHLAAEVVPRN